MPGPVLIVAAEAREVAAHLGPRLPGERLIALASAEGLDEALAAAPDAAFMIRSDGIAPDACRRVLDHPSIRWVQVGGSGYEWLGGWDRARLAVTNAAGVLAPHLAETTIGAMTALNFGLPRYRDDQQARRWRPGTFRPLAGQRLLVVGAGAIGREVAVRAAALGMEVAGVNRSGRPAGPIAAMHGLADLDAALSWADVVSCHLRLTPETEGLFDARRLGLMRRGALFLNSARGGCVVESALLSALASGHLGGAWCDVFAEEPLPPASPLWHLPNLLITPHCADQIDGWALRFADFFAANLARFRAGEPLVNVVAR
ncbi:D-2-hydroxyacid dehydrogenase [Limibaculum sp. FT325]|uniref:D-2-hydroxyacid dehydrogenase n=1 Tax=Thermohalobaculum sediminis TaxID=2939436 RepID=UPI0020BE7FE9|nr:D-2-hydroxyacid dehydrogenase [Limibaculum sediminis]MCL5777721.1 D-2-hydroxyacid dehydrogenase [Limibaculum sediminis]